MALVGVANLVLNFGDRRVLDGVNLTLDAGQHVGMVGRNGCGKSTLLKLIAGRPGLKPDSGQVQVARGASVGYLTQDHDLNPEHTLRQEAGTPPWRDWRRCTRRSIESTTIWPRPGVTSWTG